MQKRRSWSRSMGRSPLGVCLVLIAATLLLLTAVNPGRGPAARSAQAATPAPAAGTPVAVPILVTAQGLVPAPAAATALYVSGGLSRSVDGGRTWQPVGPLPPARGIVAAGDDAALLLAGTLPACASAGVAPGWQELVRSVDGGVTWDVVPGETGTLPLAVWATPRIAVGASCAGLRLSVDAGQTWSPAPLLDPGYEVSAFAVVAGRASSAPAALVVGTAEGGTSQLWRLDLTDPSQPTISAPLISFWGGAAVAAQTGADGRERYVVGTANGILVSEDGGNQWHRSRLGLETVTLSVDPTQGPIPAAEMERGFGITAVAIDPAQLRRLFAGTVGGLFRSTDGGGTWQQLPVTPGLISALHLTADGRQLIMQTDHGLVYLAIGDEAGEPTH